jgi:serine/threonine protein kinase
VYAPPETIQAFHNGATSIVADSAADIWAIGVMTFELVTHRRAFNCFTWPKFDVILAALGKRVYDWESEVGTFKNVPELRILRKVVHACLQRDPVDRPSARDLLKMLNSLYDRQTTVEAEIRNEGSTRSAE